jgi:photosystem II stability/assembly factor-like uncharacterized protein
MAPVPAVGARSRLPHLILLLLALTSGFPISPAGAQEVDPEDFSALEARSIGPAGMSGRIAAVDVLESDPNVVYVGAATGGVWKSVNGGQTWIPVFDDQRVLGIGSVAVFQANPDVVWVGTGEGNPRNSAGVGAGIYKSLDGGRTWTLLGLERSERIHRIVLHPSDPDVAYAGVMGPAWSDGEQRGVFRTIDGGETWQKVLFVNERTGVGDLIMDPSNPDKLFAGMWEFRRRPWFFESGGPGSGLWVTHDGGDTWKELTPDDGLPEGELGRMGLAIARSDPEVVYALVEASPSALLRSDDGGESWRTVNDEGGVAPRPFYYTDIFVDPTNELRVFNLHSRVTLSEDGGRSFQRIGDDVHPDVHALWIHPADSRLLYLGTDGGLYISRDRGESWRLVDNLPVGQFYHVSVDMDVPFNIYGGMQDNGSWRGPSDVWENGGIRNYHWEEVGFGDGFGTLVDPLDPRYGYSMSQGGGLVRFDLRTGERKGIRPWAPDSVELRFNWNAAIAADPFQPGTVYYGSQFVHKTTNRGDTWQIISPDLTTDDPQKQRQEESGGLTRDVTGAESHTTILTIAPSPAEEEVIWVGSDDGQVHVTRSSGGHWRDVTDEIDDVPDHTWIPHIEASAHRPGRAYVVFDDHRRGNWEPYVFRTNDYGDDWDRIADEDDLRGFVHTVEEDPVVPGLLFVGTEFGLWVTMDGGEEWFPWRHGVPPAPVRSLVVHPRDHDLVVGTHGRALYVVDDIRPLRAVARNPGILDSGVHVFSPPPAYLRSVSAVPGYHFAADAMFRGQSRPYGALLTYSVAGDGEERTAQVEILDGDGVVVATLEGPARRGLNRIAWDLREDLPEEDGGEGGGGRRFRMQGPEVLPGTYAVRVRVEGEESVSELEVRADPRVDIGMAERREKQAAIRRGLAMLAMTRTIRTRSREVSEALDRVLDLLEERGRDQGGEFRSLADSIRGELAGLGQVLAELNENRYTLYAMGATREAPTEAERIALARTGEGLEAVVRQMNAILFGPVGDFRERLADIDVELFPRFEPLEWTRER